MPFGSTDDRIQHFSIRPPPHFHVCMHILHVYAHICMRVLTEAQGERWPLSSITLLIYRGRIPH